MRHIESHYVESDRDAASLVTAGLPDYRLAPERCGSCGIRTGEIFNTYGDSVAWKPFAVVLDGDRIAVVCNRCFNGVDKALAAC